MLRIIFGCLDKNKDGRKVYPIIYSSDLDTGYDKLGVILTDRELVFRSMIKLQKVR